MALHSTTKKCALLSLLVSISTHCFLPSACQLNPCDEFRVYFHKYKSTILKLKFRSTFCTGNVRKSMHMYRDKASSYSNNIFISFLWEISAHNVSLWMNSNVEMKEKKENFSSHSLEMFMNNDSGAITLTPGISRSFFLIASFLLSTLFLCVRFQRD